MSEELIRRSDAIKAINESCFLDEIEEAIYELPTIEPKRGRWIPVDNGHHVRCSECGRCGFASDNFCPNCGADMRGKDDE